MCKRVRLKAEVLTEDCIIIGVNGGVVNDRPTIIFTWERRVGGEARYELYTFFAWK